MLCVVVASCGGGGGGGSSAIPATSGAGSTTPVSVATPTGSPSPVTSAGPGASPSAKPSATPVATPTPTINPTPTPTPSPTPVSVTASGRVVDDAGSPVAGASVYVGGNLPTGSTPVTSSYGAVSTTAADGSFTVTGIQGVNTAYDYDPAHNGWVGTWIVVWPKDSALPVYHAVRVFANPMGANPLGRLRWSG